MYEIRSEMHMHYMKKIDTIVFLDRMGDFKASPPPSLLPPLPQWIVSCLKSPGTDRVNI